MLFNQVTDTIIKIARDNSHSFIQKGVEIEKHLKKCNQDQFLSHIDHAGVIPECFNHDSTEEKLFAKYCDFLLTRFFNELGLEALTILERSDAADVQAKQDDHTLVGDAKAFRLSRTAKNAKDFKVEALNSWRKGADYACLIGPLYQYPNTKSQIYSQSIRYNVTLLSYTHLAFLLRNKQSLLKNSLKSLWELPKSLKLSQSAKDYWTVLDKKILDLTGKATVDWEKAVQNQFNVLPDNATEQINFWENEKKRVLALPREKAVKELVKALKIDSKIRIIKRTAHLID